MQYQFAIIVLLATSQNGSTSTKKMGHNKTCFSLTTELCRKILERNLTNRENCNRKFIEFQLEGFEHDIGNEIGYVNWTANKNQDMFGNKTCERKLVLNVCNITTRLVDDFACGNISSQNNNKAAWDKLSFFGVLRNLFCNLLQIDDILKANSTLESSCSVSSAVFPLYENSNITLNKVRKYKPTTARLFKEDIKNELKSICIEFKIADSECNCETFKISHRFGGQEFSMCILSNHQKKDIDYILENKEESFTPELMHLTCNFLNLDEEQCTCDKIHIGIEGSKKNICKIHVEGGEFVTPSLEEICDLFGIPRNICDCSLIKFDPKEKLTQTFCEFYKSLNETKTVYVKIYAGAYVKPYAAIATISSCIGILGNGLVVAMALKLRRTLPRCKRLFAVLAFSDLVFAVIQFIRIVPKYYAYDWKYGRFMCKILKSCEHLGSMVAIGIILIISIERYIGILEPFQRGMSRSALVLLLSWNLILAIAAVAPLLKYNDIDRTGQCRTVWKDLHFHGLIYDIYIMLAYYLIPVLAISILYTKIVLNLRGTVKFGSGNWIADPRLRRKRIFENKRTIYMLIAVVVAFAILVFPYHVVNMYFAVHYLNGVYISTTMIDIDTYYALMYFKFLPYPLHVAVNPIIYCLMDSKWRQDVLRLLMFIPKRARAYSTTLSTNWSSYMRRRSSAVDRSTEDLRMDNFSNLKARRETIEVDISNILRTPMDKRMKHYSDSSAKSADSDCSLVHDLHDPFT